MIPRKHKELLQTIGTYADKLGIKAWIVGGAVRDFYLGKDTKDLDLTFEGSPESVANFCLRTWGGEKRKFSQFNTYRVTLDSGMKLDLVHARKEFYARPGALPEVTPSTIKDDLFRRDFTANAIYYDIKSESIIDFYNGVKDTRQKTLRTVETPEFVFASDGLRMLRLVRIACELNFKINKQSFDMAKSMIDNLKDISKERFSKEITSILFADYKYASVGAVDAHIKGVKYLTSLGAWKYVFNDLFKQYNITNPKLVGNWFEMLQQSTAGYRICAFCIDFLRAVGIKIESKSIALLLGASGLSFNKKDVLKYTRIILGFLDVVGGFASTDQKRMFIQKNIDIIDLAINGNDLISVFPKLPKNQFSQILEHLLNICCIAPELNQRATLLDIVSKYINK